MNRTLLTVTVGLILVLLPASACASSIVNFSSPSGNIGCEMHKSSTGAAASDRLVYCQSTKPAHSVTLTPNSAISTCFAHGTIGCVGDAGDVTVITLDYGKSIRADWGYCQSTKSGVRCVVSATGRGFEISRSGIRKLR